MSQASHLSPDRSVRQKLTQRCPGVKGALGGRGGGSLEATHHFLKRGFLRSSEAKKLAHKGLSSLQNIRKSSKEKFASTLPIYTHRVQTQQPERAMRSQFFKTKFLKNGFGKKFLIDVFT